MASLGHGQDGRLVTAVVATAWRTLFYSFSGLSLNFLYFFFPEFGLVPVAWVNHLIGILKFLGWAGGGWRGLNFMKREAQS